MSIDLAADLSTSAILLVVVAALVITAIVGTARRSRGHKLSPWELENEAHAQFVPSSDVHNPRCPRCHGRGKLAGLAGRDCPVCLGHKHVRFGPGA